MSNVSERHESSSKSEDSKSSWPTIKSMPPHFLLIKCMSPSQHANKEGCKQGCSLRRKKRKFTLIIQISFFSLYCMQPTIPTEARSPWRNMIISSYCTPNLFIQAQKRELQEAKQRLISKAENNFMFKRNAQRLFTFYPIIECMFVNAIVRVIAAAS